MAASFDSYKIFYYVGKYKNITHAASALFLSQSTVSRVIQSLEAELGCRLFFRTKHGVALTEEGEALYSHVSKACEQIYIGEEAVKQMQKLAEGTLRVGVSNLENTYLLMPAVRAFADSFPSVRIEFSSAGLFPYNDAVEALLSSKIDVACVLAPTTGFAPSNARAEFLSNKAIDVFSVEIFHDIIIANSEFKHLKSGRYLLEDLQGYPFVSLSRSVDEPTFLNDLFLSRGIHITPRYVVDSISMFIPIVKYCKCLAVVPAALRDEFEGTGIFEVAMETPLASHSLNILTAKTVSPNVTKEAFVHQLKQSIASRGFHFINR